MVGAPRAAVKGGAEASIPCAEAYEPACYGPPGSSPYYRMQPDFWHDRWSSGQIGFHLPAENPRLVAHWAKIAKPGARVLVPLCGKSVDLAWLADRGHEVVGVELSEVAARSFFEERGLAPEISTAGPFRVFRHGRVSIAVGDFFAATPDTFGGPFELAYDRASLIALPPELRDRYVATLRSLLAPGARVLLVTLDFDAPGGPPFSVDAAAVSALHHGSRLELFEEVDTTADSPNLVARGASRASELVFLVEPSA